MDEFYQAAPQLGNQYQEDKLLRSYLERRVSPSVLSQIEPGLHALGARAVGDIQTLGEQAESEPPQHVPYDPWGRRIDEIRVSKAWTALDGISATEGLVATAYQREHGSISRVHQFARAHLFGPPSAIYTCPLAMSDGAARAIELYGDQAMKEGAFKRLTSTDPSLFWTSGQWMTERTGGSDVGTTSTVARRDGEGFSLYGTKWFTSATTSQMAMALARIEGAPEGSRGLSLFYVELRDEKGRLRNIRVNRLKDKLGTRALPTAELTLEGTPARLVGGEGDGVRKIASLFNITRIWNACSAVSYMRRGLALAMDYATRREAFGRKLIDHPLHAETLAELAVEYQHAFLLSFRAVELLGRDETGEASAEERAVLRLLTPLAKLSTAKQSVAVLSEVMESFGGAGYIEDTGLPRLLRDAQVLPIWEGTTNVLSLDVLRAIEKEQALEPFLKEVETRLSGIQGRELQAALNQAARSLDDVRAFAGSVMAAELAVRQANARRLALMLSRLQSTSLVLEHANGTGLDSDISVATRFNSIGSSRRILDPWC